MAFRHVVLRIASPANHRFLFCPLKRYCGQNLFRSTWGISGYPKSLLIIGLDLGYNIVIMKELRKSEPKPTYDDANIYLQVVEMITASEVVDASLWVFSESFPGDTMIKSYPDDEKWVKLDKLLKVLDAVAVLHKHQLLHRDLIFATLPLIALWERLEALIKGVREASGIRQLYENIEPMVEAAREWEKIED